MSKWNNGKTLAVLSALAMSALGAMGCSSDDTSSGTATDSGTTGGTDTGSTADSSVAPGPGASLKCASSGKNAFDTYMAAGFVAVNKSIIAGAVGDTSGKLGTSFSKIGSGAPASTADNAATFEGKLAAFLVYAYGGPASITYTDNKTYVGQQDMVSAHTGLSITSDQYDYFVTSVIVPALTSNGVTAADVSSCFAPIVQDAAFKASIVGH